MMKPKQSTPNHRKSTCPTLAQLWAIKPGQRLVYYTGNLEKDLENSKVAIEDGRPMEPAARYAQLLEDIASTAHALWEAGRVRLHKVPVRRPMPRAARRGASGHCDVIQYIAEGVR